MIADDVGGATTSAPRRSLRHDPALALTESVSRLAELIGSAQHCVFVTGAGISTNAGIRDYRGPNGVWTEARAAGLVVGEPGERTRTGKSPPKPLPWDEAMYRSLPAASPTLTHRVITQMACAEPPLVQHVITQNEDGLHLRSGLPPVRLSELHGNAFVELCGCYASGDSDSDLGSSSSSSSSSEGEGEGEGGGDKASAVERTEEAERSEARRLRPAGCGAAIVRDFVTYYGETYARLNAAGRHVTSRGCPHCRPAPSPRGADEGSGSGGASPMQGIGWLLDSTVDFGEVPGGFPWGRNPVHNVPAAKHHMLRADLVVAWGSSLGVLANYFDPWCPSSKWAKPLPHGLRPAAPLAAAAEAAPAPACAGKRIRRGGRGGAGDARSRKPSSPCRLVVINRGKAVDEELAALKIDADVDDVAVELHRLLGLPPPPPYRPEEDPLFRRAMAPREGEPAAPWRFAPAGD